MSNETIIMDNFTCLEDADFSIAVEDVRVDYCHTVSHGFEANFEVDSVVEAIDGTDLDNFYYIGKDELDLLLTKSTNINVDKLANIIRRLLADYLILEDTWNGWCQLKDEGVGELANRIAHLMSKE